MPGIRWFTFRQGNRSEYLALYVLSSLGIAVKVPLEEDIGADFHCSLAQIEGHKMTFQAPFIVQVKSNPEPIIYGGPNKLNKWKKEEIDWLFSQELPLLIGLVDKDNLKVNLFTTSNMWSARYSGGNVGQVILQPNTPSSNDIDIAMPKSITVSEWPPGIGDQKKWEVPLGPALVSISIDDLEDKDTMDLYRKVLLRALMLEQENITYRRLQVHFSKWPLRITTNKYEDFIYGVFYAANLIPGRNTDAQLRSLAPIIATLAFNYKSQKRYSEIQNLKSIAKLIPDGVELNLLRRDIPELFDDE